MIKILLAPDKFKTTLSSKQVSESITRGIKETFPQASISSLVVSDGGEGFLDTLEQVEDLDRHPVKVPNPKGRYRPGYLGVSKRNQRIYIESSQATGFHWLEENERNPLDTSSGGLAVLLAAALELKPKEIFIGLGSSATTDAGVPVAKRFGYRFLDIHDKELAACASDLEWIQKIEKPAKKIFSSHPVKIFAVADVTNPPVGKNGGVRTYAPQKGAKPSDVERLEKGMRQLLSVIQRDSDRDLTSLPCGGAAGCLALGLHFFFDAEILEGSAFIFDKLDLKKRILESDIIITGEGSFDEQSFFGKITGRIVRTAWEKGKKVFLVTGREKVPVISESKVESFFSVEALVQKGSHSGIKESMEALRAHGKSIGHLLRKL